MTLCREAATVKGHDLFDFDMLGLAPQLSKALKDNGLTEPTPIQNQAIPLALEGHDVLGLAQPPSSLRFARCLC